MEDIIKNITGSEFAKCEWNKMDIVGLFYSGFVRCHVVKDGVIQDFEFSKEQIVDIYNRINSDVDKRSDNDNKLVISITKNNDYSLSYGFDKEFAVEHLKG